MGRYGFVSDVESFGSNPAIWFKTVTQSETFLVRIPGTSIELTNGIRPNLETKP